MCFYSTNSEQQNKSARSCGDRQFREAHTRGALRWRRVRNARRQAVARLITRTAKRAVWAAVRVLVLRPLRREKRLAHFTAARHSFANLGVPLEHIRRLQGVDLARCAHRDGTPRPRMVVGRALLRDFVPAAYFIFATTPRVRYILFAEDDCRMKREATLDALT